MRKFIAVMLAAVVAAAALAGCGSSSDSESTTTQAAAVTDADTSDETEGAVSAGTAEITEGMCETPVILTSIGQSADVDIVNTLCTKAGLDVYENATITADELTDSYKTLLLSVGGSSKGLGAAGIDSDEELERTSALLAKAKELGMTIVATHTGGDARRGTLSDSFIEPAFEAADIAIVVNDGNTDGFISDILDANGTPTAYIDQATDAIEVLTTLFGL